MRLFLLGLLGSFFFLSCLATDYTHIVGDSTINLDGSAWTGSSAILISTDCNFKQFVDFDDFGKDPGSASTSSKEDCCKQCAATFGCASAVWDGSVCFFKSLDAKPVSTSKSVWACELPVKRFSIPSTVPGDVITDLQNARMIPDPYMDLNFLTNASLWGRFDWGLSTTVSLTSPFSSSSQELFLVFEGVKMGAQVFFEENLLGTIDDQFLRYVFPLSKHLSPSKTDYSLRVELSSSIPCHNRFMACTGGWDWAPYTNTFQESVPTFSRGIWKSVYVVRTTTSLPAITHIKPLVLYLGPYPTSPLQDHSHGGFNVTITTYFQSTFPIKGTLVVTSEWGQSGCADISFTPSTSTTEFNSTIVLSADAASINLWWPNGMGDHPLYTIDATFAPQQQQQEGSDGLEFPPALQPPRASLTCVQRHLINSRNGAAGASVSVQRRIGFRVFALVTGNDTDPEYVSKAMSEEGSELLGMFFRVNGAPMFAKGANMIPMEELEGRMRDQNHRTLVESVAAAHMNTLRVWGGGMYLPDAWYDACDENGIVVYHDMQYATGGPHDKGGGPQVVPTQVNEMIHQIRRLSHHPSIVIWDGCNECGGYGIYITFVMAVVVAEDWSRAVWPSCPSYGWLTGVHKLTMMPNGNTLNSISKADVKIETHGPYFHGGGFPAVNGGVHGAAIGWQPVPFDPMMPAPFPNVLPPIGPQHQNIFTSEFGSSAFSSFESMSGTLSASNWGVHGAEPWDNCTLGFASQCTGSNAMAQRNYPCDNLIMTFFNFTGYNNTGESSFKQQLYLCMLGQALVIKQQLEVTRATNSFGTLLWQLGEIWPTGGWGTLEYGGADNSHGQVPGGRWKILHHILASSTFTDVTVACGAGGVCYARNDLPYPFLGTLVVNAIDVATGDTSAINSTTLSIAAGAGAVISFTLPMLPPAAKTLIEATVTDNTGAVVTHNIIHMLPPRNMTFPSTRVSATVADQPNADGTVNVNIQVSPAPAYYTTLTTEAYGRFSENAIFISANTVRVVKFIPFGNLDLGTLKTTLRVEHLAMYQ